MDTRIGYPNEHLGKGMDEVKSPMYATGVGLVIKGLQDVEREMRREKNTLKPSTKTETSEPTRKKGRWFDIFKNTISDEDDDPTM
jgi:cell division protein FtsA